MAEEWRVTPSTNTSTGYRGVGTFYEYFHWIPPLEQGPNIVVEDGFVECIFIERAPDEEAAYWP